MALQKVNGNNITTKEKEQASSYKPMSMKLQIMQKSLSAKSKSVRLNKTEMHSLEFEI